MSVEQKVIEIVKIKTVGEAIDYIERETKKKTA